MKFFPVREFSPENERENARNEKRKFKEELVMISFGFDLNEKLLVSWERWKPESEESFLIIK